MKKLLVLLAGWMFGLSLSASIDWGYHQERYGIPHESYDFEMDGVYYGIVSELRGEVQVMYKGRTGCDPYPVEEFEPPHFVGEYRNVYVVEGDKLGHPEGCYEGDVIIPETVEHAGKTYSVVRITYGAFAWSDRLKSVKLPSSLREIRYGAFSMCTSLEHIELPEGTIVSGGAFFGCSALTSLDLSGCVLQYGFPNDHVVCRCAGLKEIYLPGRLEFEMPVGYYLEDEYKKRWFYDYFTAYDDCPYPLQPGLSYDIDEAPEYSRQYRYGEREEPYWGDKFYIYLELEDCPELAAVHLSAENPEDMTEFNEVNPDIWTGRYDDCVLYVPKGSLEAYRSASPWSNFRQIVEEDAQSVIRNVVNDGETSAASVERRIYDMFGRLHCIVPAGEEPHLASGLYIECGHNYSRKLSVR